MRSNVYPVIVSCVMFFFLLVSAAEQGGAHIIHLKDGSRIKTENVWEKKAGCMLTEAGLQKLKKEGLPQQVFLGAQSLVERPAKDTRQFLNFLQIRIGREQLKEYGETILQYVDEKTFIKYQQHDGVLSIDKSLVEKIEDEEVKSVQPIVEIRDKAFLAAVAATREKLMETWQRLKKKRMNAKTGTTRRKELEKEENAALALIELLDQDPFAYFMRNDPEKINRQFLENLDLSKETCTLLCGGTPEKKSDDPSVLSKDYGWKFERCIGYCPVKE